MGDSISITIEERKVEVTVLTPTLTQINLLAPVILEGGGGGWSRGAHGVISVTEEFSANNTEHTASINADIDFTFADFSELQPRIRIKLTVASGNPDVTPPAAADLSADSPQSLNNMATGIYIIEVVSFSDGADYSYTVSHFEAGATSSITTPIYVGDDIPLTFSEAQDPATVLTIGNGTGSVELFDKIVGTYTPASISTPDDTIWTFSPNSDLTVGNSYEFYLKKEITSLVGNRKHSGQNPPSFIAESIYEDLTTYTKVDPSGALTVTPFKVDGVNIPRDADARLHWDFGVDHFDGDFTIDFELYNDSGDLNAQFVPWMMSNSVGNARDLDLGAVADLLYCIMVPNSSAPPTTKISITETLAGSRTSSSFITLALLTLYYCRAVRVYATDQLTLSVYSDSDRTVLVGSATITLVAKIAYSIFYPMNSWNSGNALYCTAYTQKFRIY